MDVGDPASDGVFDGDHGKVSPALGHHRKDVLKGRAGHRLEFGIDNPAGSVGVRPGLSLIGNSGSRRTRRTCWCGGNCCLSHIAKPRQQVRAG